MCVWGEGGYSSIGQSVTEAHPWSGCHSSSQWDSLMRVTLCVISSHSVQLCRLGEGTRAGGTTGPAHRKSVSGITRGSTENCVCVSSICSGQCEYLSTRVLVQSCPVTADVTDRTDRIQVDFVELIIIQTFGSAKLKDEDNDRLVHN